MAVEITVKNNLGTIAAGLQEKADRICEASAYRIQGEWQRRVHVDTGRLRRSITAQKDPDGGFTVYSDVDYSIYQEFGTVYIAPNPAATQAAELERPRFEAAMGRLLE